jgi:Short C-terminal domain
MSKQDKKHTGTFRQDKLMPDETLEAQLDGWLDKPSGQGGVIKHNGQFVLTNKRACFYSKAPFEEIFETIPLSKITSVETSSLMGYRVLRLHTAHDDLEFKTLEAKALFDTLLAHLERLRNEPAASADSITDQIKKLGELRDAGFLTNEEFNAKKAELLARL